MIEKYTTKSAFQTKRIGMKLAKTILGVKNKSRKEAIIIILKGDLGGGKTTFCQGFANGLGIRERILSPTFVILKKFLLSVPYYRFFYHIDCYRIRDIKELSIFGFEEIINNPNNIVAIEWGDIIKSIIPNNSILVEFDFINRDIREIRLKLPNY